MKGYTMSGKSNGCTFGTSKQGTSKSIRNCGFTSMAAYPTRDDRTHVFFTWHNHENNEFTITNIPTIYLFTSLYNPSSFSFKENLNYGDKSPFTEELSSCIDITDLASEGALYHNWLEPGYYWGVILYYNFKIDDEEFWAGEWIGYLDATWDNLISGAPSLNYNESSNTLTIESSRTGKRIIEFCNTDKSIGYPTKISDSRTLEEMYSVTLLNLEGENPFMTFFDNLNQNKVERWEKGTYSVAVNLIGGSSANNNSTINKAVLNALELINDVMNEFGVYFIKTSAPTGNITVTVDTEEELFGIDLETSYEAIGGQWSTITDSSGVIKSAEIKLANDYYEYVPYCTYETVALEELLQSMGAGYDQVEYPEDTIHVEFNYYNKPSDSIPERDKDILRLLYCDYVDCGMNCTELALALNLPKGCYLYSDSTSNTTMSVPLNFLEKGSNYMVRAFIVNSKGRVSQTSDWLMISTPEISLEEWNWTSPMTGQLSVTTDGQIHPVTASEWNEFTNKLMGLKDYLISLGYVFPDFPSAFSKADPEVPIKDLYNEVSYAMFVLCNNSYGNVTDIYTPINNDTELSAKLFTSLRNNYNYIINNL